MRCTPTSSLMPSRIGMVLSLVALTAALCGEGWCQGAGILSQIREKPATSVKVEVKESEAKKPAEVKVEVNGKSTAVHSGAKETVGTSKPSPHPEQRFAPVDTKKIDQAGEQIGKKLDEIAEKSSYHLGDWVKTKAFNGITWLQLFACLAVLLLVLVVDRTLNRAMRRRLQRSQVEERPPTWPEVLLEAVCKPLCLFIWVYGTYAALSPILPHLEGSFGAEGLLHFARRAADIGGILAVVWFIYRTVRLVDVELEQRAKSPESRIADLEASLIGKTLRWVILIGGAVLILQYVTGLHAGPVLASLGIGGLAIALAAKESIANLFGTVTIVFDKPFRIGDRVKIENYDGFIESVGYRSTKVRLWNGNLVNLPNQKIITSSLENFARRPHIWWKTNITITYDTPPDKVNRAVEIIKEILEHDEDSCTEHQPWVFFDGFNESSLNIRLVAWFKRVGREPTQFDYYTWRERNCDKILRRLNEEGIQFAFPTRTTYLANDDERQLKIQMLMGDERRDRSERAEQ
jgi:MscS family membrane protein